jgi:hypothetical protein
MGWFASASGGGDNAPFESFTAPPTTPGVAVTGRITDQDSGAGVAGVQVGFGGHLSNLASDLAATTDAAGNFTIAAVPPPVVVRHRDLVHVGRSALPARFGKTRTQLAWRQQHQSVMLDAMKQLL